MTTLHLETQIAAPPERCFDLSRSIDLHMASTHGTSERAIAGVTSGLIGPNEEVTWQARHFGLMLKHASRISKYDRPRMFQDRMIRGVFAHFEHDHLYERTATGTTMTDILRFQAPLGFLGRVAGRAFLANYLTNFLQTRNQHIKQTAESDSWRTYLAH